MIFKATRKAMPSYTRLKILFSYTAALVMVFTLINPVAVAALSPEQRNIYESGVRYFDIEEAQIICGGVTNLSGSDNAEKIWNFFRSKELSPQQAAGVMGNLKEESQFNPDAREPNGIGYGIAQWSFGRRTALEKAAAEKGVNVADLSFQLEYLYSESVSRQSLTHRGMNEWEGLKRETTVSGATIYWLKNFERAGIPRPQRRIQFGEDILIQFGSGTDITTGGGTDSCSDAVSSEGCPTSPVPEGQTVMASGIRVHPCISEEVNRIVALAKSQGISLGGGGWRDNAKQIELRKKHCGTSQYAIYEMPSGQCSPPTARPGASKHERGTAVDFTCNGRSIGSRSHPCFNFLNNNTTLKNLPSEPWHWSIDGK